jgi:hypothetical protein
MIEVYLWNTAFAVAFAGVGNMIGHKLAASKYQSFVDAIVDLTIQKLAKDGYIQTRGFGEDQELLKWYERNEDEQR